MTVENGGVLGPTCSSTRRVKQGLSLPPLWGVRCKAAVLVGWMPALEWRASWCPTWDQ